MHGAEPDGSVAHRRTLSQGKLLGFLASQPPCTVAMEACASAHYWGREIAALGHEVRLLVTLAIPFLSVHRVAAQETVAVTGEDRPIESALDGSSASPCMSPARRGPRARCVQ